MVQQLIHCLLVLPYSVIDLGQIGSYYGLLHDSTKPSPKPESITQLGLQWPLLLTWFNFNPSMDK